MLDIQMVGSVSILKARSALTGDSLAQCRKHLDECLSRRRSLIVLDLSDSPLIHSEGLEFIVDAQQRCLSHGGKLVVAEPQPLCAEILSITGVEACVAVFHDLRSALSDFAK
jgi:anti-anti-sigma factor